MEAFISALERRLPRAARRLAPCPDRPVTASSGRVFLLLSLWDDDDDDGTSLSDGGILEDDPACHMRDSICFRKCCCGPMTHPGRQTRIHPIASAAVKR